MATTINDRSAKNVHVQSLGAVKSGAHKGMVKLKTLETAGEAEGLRRLP